MKKIFTLIALAMLTLGAMAQSKTLSAADPTVIYSLTTTGDYGTDNGSNSFTKDGVTYEKSGVSNNDPATDEAEPYRWRFTSTGTYVGCILDNPLKAGDVIEITAQASSASSGLYLILRTEGSNKADAAATITCGSTSEKTYSYTVTATDEFVGKSKFYVMIGNSKANTYKIRMRQIRVLEYATEPTALTESKAWDYSEYAVTDATSAGFVCDNLYYGFGVSVVSVSGVRNDGDESSVSLTQSMLNLPGNSGKSGDNSFNADNGKYLLFKVAAGSGTIKVKTLPNGKNRKSLFCKVGDSDAQEYSQNGSTVMKTNTFTYNVTEDTPVYLYVGGNVGTYRIATIEVTPGGTTGISMAKATTPNENNYYTLEGIKTQHPVKGKIYVYQGKKIVY